MPKAKAKARGPKKLRDPQPQQGESSSGSNRKDPNQMDAAMYELLPTGLDGRDKRVAVQWRGKCFCCSEQLSFAMCLNALLESAETKNRSGLAHWTLNLLNFSKDNHELASQLMLKGGCIKALHPFLISSVKLGKDKANGLRIMTPPHMHAKGVPKVLDFDSSVQLVVIELMWLMMQDEDGVSGVQECPAAVSSLVKSLKNSSDDRYRVLALQVMSSLLSAAAAAKVDSIATQMVEQGAIDAVSNAARDTKNAVVLCAASVVCILLTQQSPGADYFIGDMGLRLVMPRLQGKVGRDFIAKGMEQIMEGAFDKEASEGKYSWWAQYNMSVADCSLGELRACAVGCLRALDSSIPPRPAEQRPLHKLGLVMCPHESHAGCGHVHHGHPDDKGATVPAGGSDSSAGDDAECSDHGCCSHQHHHHHHHHEHEHAAGGQRRHHHHHHHHHDNDGCCEHHHDDHHHDDHHHDDHHHHHRHHHDNGHHHDQQHQHAHHHHHDHHADTAHQCAGHHHGSADSPASADGSAQVAADDADPGAASKVQQAAGVAAAASAGHRGQPSAIQAAGRLEPGSANGKKVQQQAEADAVDGLGSLSLNECKQQC
eukprot:jgi/Chrzof1/2628/Cz11g23030.t1